MKARTQVNLLLFMILICAHRGHGADAWIKVSGPNFEMYTTNSEKDAARALQVFEQVRYFFLETSHAQPDSKTPLYIVAFRSEREYSPYRLNAGAFAYYIRTHNRDYIVMQDLDPAHYPAIIHEYTHLIVAHLSLHFPVWLNEGLAEFYSSLEARGNQAVVGGIPPGRLALLQSAPWLDLKALFAVDETSPFYNERDKMSIFYAESWALTHMLEFSDAYRGKFPAFLSAMASGKPSEYCFQSIYGKNLAAVTTDLRAYVHPSSLRAGVVDVNLPHSAFETKSMAVAPLETELVLADLLASRKQTWSEAAKRLRTLEQDHPDNVEIQESIAYLDWERNQTSPAREHIERAVQLGSNDPDVLYLYAQLLHQTNATDEQVLAILERVVAAQPDFTDAQLNLAMTAMSMQNWGRAATALSSIKTVKPDRAYFVFSAISRCDLALGNIAAAHEAAVQAQPYAHTSEEKTDAHQLLAQFDSIPTPEQAPVASNPEPTEAPMPVPASEPTASPKPATRRVPTRDEATVNWAGDLQHVEATADSFECLGKELRMHVKVNSKPMVFQVDNPNEIVIRNTGGSTMNLSCGPQKPFPIGIFYIPTPESSMIAGKVRELVF